MPHPRRRDKGVNLVNYAASAYSLLPTKNLKAEINEPTNGARRAYHPTSMLSKPKHPQMILQIYKYFLEMNRLPLDLGIPKYLKKD